MESWGCVLGLGRAWDKGFGVLGSGLEALPEGLQLKVGGEGKGLQD